MSYSLKGRNVLVAGGSRGLGAVVAEKFASEGSNVVINYFSNEDRAKETAARIESEYGVKTSIVQGDMEVQEDCVRVVRFAIETLGGLDVVISNSGWTKLSLFGDLNALNEQDWDKCWAANVKAHLHLFREASSTFNSNPEGGIFIITSSVAASSQGGSSMAYSVTKAAGLHLMKCLAKSQGQKVRINAVLPGFMATDWTAAFPQQAVQKHLDQTILKHGVDLEDCASMYIAIAKNASMTGHTVQVDCGISI